jgi:hypothetical protein
MTQYRRDSIIEVEWLVLIFGFLWFRFRFIYEILGWLNNLSMLLLSSATDLFIARLILLFNFDFVMLVLVGMLGLLVVSKFSLWRLHVVIIVGGKGLIYHLHCGIILLMHLLKLELGHVVLWITFRSSPHLGPLLLVTFTSVFLIRLPTY